jgi:hypothetical protein
VVTTESRHLQSADELGISLFLPSWYTNIAPDLVRVATPPLIRVMVTTQSLASSMARTTIFLGSWYLQRKRHH